MTPKEQLEYLYQEANFGSLEHVKCIEAFKAVEKSLSNYEQLQCDVKRYIKLEKSMGMMNTWLGTLDEMKEFSILKDKFLKLGKKE